MSARATALLRGARWALVALAAILVAPLLLVVAMALRAELPPELSAVASSSLRVEDRTGRLLREVRADDGKRARSLSRAEIGPRAERALLAAEDQRFFTHHGVDPLAVVRAAVSDLRALRVVSGASTITMQLARTVRPHRRNLFGKLEEIALALRIERSLSKERILEEYVNRVDFGPGLRGIGAASQAYFDKAPTELSVAEAALLAGLPQGPTLYSLSARPELARRRRDRVLARMAAMGALSEEERLRAASEPVFRPRATASFGAPHLVDALTSGALGARQWGLASAMADGKPRRVRTTLDGALQHTAEAALVASLAPLESRHVTAGAVVVLDNATSDVLAYVGSPNFFADAALGQNDGARALRQPGSALKPFLYAFAMERLGFTAATLLPDVELHLRLEDGSDYAPHDYDRAFRGPVRLRPALGSSLNVPAVWTATQLGEGVFLAGLRDLGFSSLREDATYYGPALALGDGEVTLVELANAYATLARGGVYRPLRFVREVESAGGAPIALAPGPSHRVFGAATSRVITDVLADKGARLAAFGEGEALRFDTPVAVKTGTSKGFRDNWAIGYSAAVTVAVWVGNFDGSPMDAVSGITGAGPLFHSVMEAALAHRKAAKHAGEDIDSADRPELRRVAICALSGGAPGPSCGERIFESLPPAAADELAPCSIHTELAIDRRNGLLAGPACPAGVVEQRVFERWSPEAEAWAANAERPVPPHGFSPLCPPTEREQDATGGALQIAYPHDGARFVLDPDRPRAMQAVSVRVTAPAGVREIVLRVDGAVAARGHTPFVATWTLEPGEHTLLAEASGAGAAEPVHIAVR